MSFIWLKEEGTKLILAANRTKLLLDKIYMNAKFTEQQQQQKINSVVSEIISFPSLKKIRNQEIFSCFFWILEDRIQLYDLCRSCFLFFVF